MTLADQRTLLVLLYRQNEFVKQNLLDYFEVLEEKLLGNRLILITSLLLLRQEECMDDHRLVRKAISYLVIVVPKS